ncbi:MAG: DNA-formamidopyrimidine glycosylase [Magnetovibrio sp.]|nr:DNA-formamidopyrimidine glycosylase [Magnetovibrio sp.]|tara:strand:+ start:2993 stop:3823 length:831 start_codon:yes stop_codon:yes gene_type:complete
MPELPEVETVCRGLAEALIGRKLVRVIANRPNLRFPLPNDLGQRLIGNSISAVKRRAKFILIEMRTSDVLIAHLGMSGRFRIYQNTPPPENTHDHVIFETESGSVIRYNDPRRFGFFDLTSRDDLAENRFLSDLGPEPLENTFTPDVFIKHIKSRKTSLKAALLDQHIVAGLGNIYACEALFMARLSPRRKTHTVGPKRATALVDAIKTVLANAIAQGGSSLRDHRKTNGELGYFQHTLQVYGQENKACPRCGIGYQITRINQSGRSTFFCPHCQR